MTKVTDLLLRQQFKLLMQIPKVVQKSVHGIGFKVQEYTNKWSNYCEETRSYCFTKSGKNSLHSCDLNELYLSFIQKLWYTDNVTKLLDR